MDQMKLTEDLWQHGQNGQLHRA